MSLDLISKMNLAQFIRMKFAYKGVDKINLFITNIYVFDIFENKNIKFGDLVFCRKLPVWKKSKKKKK